MATMPRATSSPAIFDLPLEVWNAILGHIDATLPVRDRRALAQSHAAFAWYLRPSLMERTTVFPLHKAFPLRPASVWFRSNPQFRPMVRELVIRPRTSPDQNGTGFPKPIPAKDILLLCALLPNLRHLRLVEIEVDLGGLPISLSPTVRTAVARLTLEFYDQDYLRRALVGVAAHMGSLAELSIEGDADFTWEEAFQLRDAIAPYAFTPYRFSVMRCGLFKCRATTILMTAMASTLTHVNIQLWPIAEGHYEMFGFDCINLGDLEALVYLSVDLPLAISSWYNGASHADPLIHMLDNAPSSLEQVSVTLRRCRQRPTSFADEVARFPIERFYYIAAVGHWGWTLTFTVLDEDLDGQPRDQFWSTVRSSSTGWDAVTFTTLQSIAIIM